MSTIRTVGVIGAGTMGNGIAQACAAVGVEAVMVDGGRVQPTTVESRRNEWIRDNLDDLDAYAEYHPSFAKALGEWRTAQEKENE